MHTTLRRATAVAFTMLTLAALVVGVAPGSGAAPPSDDPPLVAEYASRWLATQVQPDGTVVGGFDPLGDAGGAALALAAAGVEEDAFDRALGHVVANAEAFVTPFGPDDAGRLGKALILADAAGLDPTDFGGVDLVDRLLASLGAHTPGLFGAADPTFDGAFRQGLALAGLVAVGETPPAAAVDWLVDQQCDGANPDAEGGWMAYRSDTDVPCLTSDPATFSGVDSNSSAMALVGLAAVGSTPTHDGLGYLEATEEPGGGWAYYAGSLVDTNSTALAIQAFRAWDEDPGAAAWATLLGFAEPCGEEWPGAFTSPYSSGNPDVLASLDAIPAAAGTPFPLDGPVTFAAAAEPCVDPPPSSTTTSTTAPVDATTATTDPPAAPATPVPALPTFAG